MVKVYSDKIKKVSKFTEKTKEAEKEKQEVYNDILRQAKQRARAIHRTKTLTGLLAPSRSVG